MHLQTPNMSFPVDYSSYINSKYEIEFLHCISYYLEELHVRKKFESPFLSKMLDESIDYGLEKYLVVYSTYLDLKCLSPRISQFIKMISVLDGKWKTIYDIIVNVKETRHFKNEKPIVVSIDGVSFMVGCEKRFVTLLNNDLPNLIGTHCIAHYEALAT